MKSILIILKFILFFLANNITASFYIGLNGGANFSSFIGEGAESKIIVDGYSVQPKKNIKIDANLGLFLFFQFNDFFHMQMEL